MMLTYLSFTLKNSQPRKIRQAINGGHSEQTYKQTIIQKRSKKQEQKSTRKARRSV
jgi:hypothetical protein